MLFSSDSHRTMIKQSIFVFTCVAKLQHDAVCVLRKFNIFIFSKGARLQHDAKCPHVIESNEVCGRGFRQGIGPSTVVGLGLIGAAAGSERTGSRGDGLGPIGAACGSDRGAVGSDRVRLWVRSLFPDRAASRCAEAAEVIRLVLVPYKSYLVLLASVAGTWKMAFFSCLTLWSS